MKKDNRREMEKNVERQQERDGENVEGQQGTEMEKSVERQQEREGENVERQQQRNREKCERQKEIKRTLLKDKRRETDKNENRQKDRHNGDGTVIGGGGGVKLRREREEEVGRKSEGIKNEMNRKKEGQIEKTEAVKLRQDYK